MKINIEQEFALHLLNGESAEQALKSLLKSYGMENSLEAKKLLIRFALISSRPQPIFEIIPCWIKTEHALPWGDILNLLGQQGVDIPDPLLKSIFRLAKQQKTLTLLSQCIYYEEKDPRFEKQRKIVIKKFAQNQKNQRIFLLEKLEYLKNQNMLNKEGEILKKLIFMYPEDPLILGGLKDFEFRSAKNVITTHTRKARRNTHQETPLGAQEREFVKSLQQLVLGSDQLLPTNAYDYALMFYFLKEYKLALKIIERFPLTYPMEWFKAELLLSARMYIQCLAWVQVLEEKYSSDPEIPFAAAYLKALAYWGIGKKHKAIDLLKDIVNIRPHYRSAHTFLLEWGGSF